MLAAFDIGGTKTIIAVGEADKIIDSSTFPTLPGERTRAEFVSLCAEGLTKMLAGQGYGIDCIESVGISAPGMVSADGRLIFSPVTGWRDCDLAGELAGALGISVPMGIDNDVKACALAEAAATGEKSMLWVTVSTGIGGAVVSDGEIYRGSSNLAGEIGHVKVEYAPALARKCKCGQYGCAEAHASGSAVSDIVREYANRDEKFALKFAERGLEINAKGLSVLAAHGDKAALEIFADAGSYLGRALAAAQNLLDVSSIVIGGGMAASLAYMLPMIKAQLKSGAIEASRGVKISATALGYNAALNGAFALAKRAAERRE